MSAILDFEDLVSGDGSKVSRRLFADPTLYQLEKKHIFARNWIYMGHETQIPSQGDYITSFIGETPVIVARGGDGKVRAARHPADFFGCQVGTGIKTFNLSSYADRVLAEIALPQSLAPYCIQSRTRLSAGIMDTRAKAASS